MAGDHFKRDLIREWPWPTTGTEMASFIGLWNYYRLLIPHFAEDAVHFYKETAHLRVLSTPRLSTALAKLKSDVSVSVALTLPNPQKPYVLETDASSVAVGAVLKLLHGADEIATLFYRLALNSVEGN